jgi:hypothetical protein
MIVFGRVCFHNNQIAIKARLAQRCPAVHRMLVLLGYEQYQVLSMFGVKKYSCPTAQKKHFLDSETVTVAVGGTGIDFHLKK